MTSSLHGLYGLGHTRATMAITMGSKAVRRSESGKIDSMEKRGFYKESPAVSHKSFRAGPYRREAARPRHPCSRPPSNTHAQMPSHFSLFLQSHPVSVLLPTTDGGELGQLVEEGSDDRSIPLSVFPLAPPLSLSLQPRGRTKEGKLKNGAVKACEVDNKQELHKTSFAIEAMPELSAKRARTTGKELGVRLREVGKGMRKDKTEGEKPAKKLL
ncbi:hypothetical protein L1987_28969 [Smallanthus sonchifolius]|uniref:Uncharacterized protein n=1 Tax=Smallanthus sonchifolius TaxID=185202 RepID=A0ACB9I0H3_9ASTR|nr:hypothetical protein L1987_28969 [Smallanthus sonchifolius]